MHENITDRWILFVNSGAKITTCIDDTYKVHQKNSSQIFLQFSQQSLGILQQSLQTYLVILRDITALSSFNKPGGVLLSYLYADKLVMYISND